MAAGNFELRNYQRQALDRLDGYLDKVALMGAGTAFYDLVKTPYQEAPEVDPEVPYVCIRIPTGGGKTVVAAHSVGVAAQRFLHADNPMVLWLVPSTAILDQTLGALRDLSHPYRAALTERFGRNVSVLSVSEALSLSRPDAEGGACIIVGTIQAFRRVDERGKENPEGLKVYQDSGSLMDHFSGLDASQLARLDKVEGGADPVRSLCNLLRLHRPMVIVDEAHNVRTPLSFKTLARFSPSLIVELTATPQLQHDPDRGVYGSNVLFHVSAAELKAEEMIKLPIRLATDSDWRKVIGQALDSQGKLERAAKVEQAETGEYIRPIILFQAQSKSKTDPDRLTIEAVAEFLQQDKRIPRDQIALHGGGHSELDAVDSINAEDCPVRYIITVQKLREGWDCPFAYVLCSVAELSSPTAVEQLLGRVLRMPKGRRKRQDDLNRAYAFVASSSFQDVAERLRDGLVDGAGFDRIETKDLVKAHEGMNFDEERADFKHESDALEDTSEAVLAAVVAAIDRLPPSLKSRVSFERDKATLQVARSLSRDDRNMMHLAFAKVPGAERIIDRLFLRSNRIQASEQPEGGRPPFLVPRLGVMRQGVLELFSPDHFLDLPWNLAECDPVPFAERFAIQTDTKTGQIDVSREGRMKVEFAQVLQDQLAMAIQEPAWTLPRLVNWIDKGIPHRDVTKPAARVFIQRALDAVMQRKRYSLDHLARYKYELRRALAEEIKSLRVEREKSKYSALFSANTNDFQTSSDLALLMDEQSYAYNEPYKGTTKFQKHYFEIIGDLKPNGDEFRCALHLDRHPNVRFWIRNVERKRNAFWLQLPRRRFYPDFLVMLKDGTIGAVEYKGRLTAQDEDVADKRMIGQLWAEESEGACFFCIPIENDFSELDRLLQG